jgi:hypothetical protein
VAQRVRRDSGGMSWLRECVVALGGVAWLRGCGVTLVCDIAQGMWRGLLVSTPACRKVLKVVMGSNLSSAYSMQVQLCLQAYVNGSVHLRCILQLGSILCISQSHLWAVCSSKKLLRTDLKINKLLFHENTEKSLQCLRHFLYAWLLVYGDDTGSILPFAHRYWSEDAGRVFHQFPV